MENIYSAENALVGSMLIDPACIGEIVHTVTADDFRQETTRNIFSTVQAQYLSGQALDPVIIAEKLTENDKQFMAECMRMTPTANNFEAYAELVKKSGMLHKFQKLGLQLADTTEIEQSEKVVSELNSLSAATPQGTFQTAQEAANSFMDNLVERLENGVKFIPWGLHPLDEFIPTRLGNFIIIGARPSTGKSALALQCALNMAKAGYRVGFVSLEMGNEEINERIIAYLSGVSLEKLIRGKNISDEEYKRINAACEALYKLPIGFDYSCRTVQQIQARARSERWDVIFVDYIQLMGGSGKTRYEAVTSISLELQQFAHRNKILTIALSQLSRPQTTADGKERKPTVKDLRESGQLEQDADAIILMCLDDANDKLSDRYVNLDKNRNGICCDFKLTFYGDIQRFTYKRSDNYEYNSAFQ
ncbi:MAG: DnaB-like helicase C-terminal domain-containing protein [Eubacteriales bacterium]|nr:DnaB-like helicase C-terminal domain-containing protein [Eubacteriales bacterium]